MKTTNPIADFARTLNPAGGALGVLAPFALTGGHSRQDAPRARLLFDQTDDDPDPDPEEEEHRICRDCGRRPDLSVEEGGCTCS